MASFSRCYPERFVRRDLPVVKVGINFAYRNFMATCSELFGFRVVYKVYESYK